MIINEMNKMLFQCIIDFTDRLYLDDEAPS